MVVPLLVQFGAALAADRVDALAVADVRLDIGMVGEWGKVALDQLATGGAGVRFRHPPTGPSQELGGDRVDVVAPEGEEGDVGPGQHRGGGTASRLDNNEWFLS